MLCYKEKSEPSDRACYGTGLHDFRRLYLHVASSSLTPIICHVLVYCFGSFLLQDMFLSLQIFAFEGQNMTFTVGESTATRRLAHDCNSWLCHLLLLLFSRRRP